MKYRTVMVSLALDQPSDAYLAVTGDLAERFEACVIGIAASELKPPLYFTEGGYAEALLSEEKALIEKQLAELEAQFRNSLRKRAAGIEWRSALEFPTKYVVDAARAADVLVTGSRSEAIADSYALADPNDLLMQAGRPLLIVPPDAGWLDMRSVMVAWKDTREARRAIVDALPLLSVAKEVTIVEVKENGSERSDALSRVKDVAVWLLRHGISADAMVTDRNDDVVAQLDEVAANLGAGVIVAGAYGHSRLREWIFGGVTRHLMAGSGRCSLLSR